MTFTTITFLVFLSIVFALYRSLRTVRQQNVLLIGPAYVFYGWWDWRSAACSSSRASSTSGRATPSSAPTILAGAAAS